MPRMVIPVIGIGAGAAADGQVLVFHDLLGIYDGHAARFVKRYANVRDEMIRGVSAYADEVRARATPRRSTATRWPRTRSPGSTSCLREQTGEPFTGGCRSSATPAPQRVGGPWHEFVVSYPLPRWRLPSSRCSWRWAALPTPSSSRAGPSGTRRPKGGPAERRPDRHRRPPRRPRRRRYQGRVARPRAAGPRRAWQRALRRRERRAARSEAVAPRRRADREGRYQVFFDRDCGAAATRDIGDPSAAAPPRTPRSALSRWPQRNGVASGPRRAALGAEVDKPFHLIVLC